MRHPITLVVPGHSERLALYGIAPGTLLRDVLAHHERQLLHPVPPELMDRPWADFDPTCLLRSEVPGGHGRPAPPPAPPAAGAAKDGHGGTSARRGRPPAVPRPERLTDGEAVRQAYWPYIEQVASYLRNELPVLVSCEKLIAPHLWEDMTSLAQLRGVLIDDDGGDQQAGADPLAELSGGGPRRRVAALRAQLQGLKEGDVIVLPHLDLLSGSSDLGRHAEARELVETLYQYPDQLILAFVDTTLSVPDVLAERFSVRLAVSGLPTTVSAPGRPEALLGDALVTRSEAECFTDFQAEDFHKHVAGMNPVRLRQAMRYAVREHSGSPAPTMRDLRRTLLYFKAQQSSAFELPDVTLDDIGGYEDVKQEIRQTVAILSRAQDLPPDLESLRGELVPRGFIFHGPPGTGKTLFAKAIANSMSATIQVVSGPEVTDMYVGESERKIREIFASARRSAPAVIVFDEFDAIAMQRTGRSDGASRAGNSVVAQILTEMDGFRPDVPMLVIGTTNRIDLIDEALLRPSRFRQIAIDLPRLDARLAILRHHADRYGLDLEDELLHLIAGASAQRNGDELRSIMRDAAIDLHLNGVAPTPLRFGRLVGRLQHSHSELASARR